MRMKKKADLPRKMCHHCGRPFTWRKKWEKVWDEVKYCSDACRRATKGLLSNHSASPNSSGDVVRARP